MTRLPFLCNIIEEICTASILRSLNFVFPIPLKWHFHTSWNNNGLTVSQSARSYIYGLSYDLLLLQLTSPTPLQHHTALFLEACACSIMIYMYLPMFIYQSDFILYISFSMFMYWLQYVLDGEGDEEQLRSSELVIDEDQLAETIHAALFY